MSVPSPFKTKVVGLTFVAGYPNNVERLEAYAAENPGPTEALLVRNPANPYDGNALEVHIPVLGDMAMIGHIPKNVAARVSPEIDAGTPWEATLEKVAVHPDHPFNPGVHLTLSRGNPVDQDEPW
jgi:hypothetical protein